MLESTLPLCLLLPHHDCWTYCDFIDLYPNVQARSIFTLHLTILVTSRTSWGFTDASSALSPVYCAAWPHWSWVNNDMDNVTQPVHMFWNHKLQTPTRYRQDHVVAMGIGVNKSFRRVGKSIFPFWTSCSSHSHCYFLHCHCGYNSCCCFYNQFDCGAIECHIIYKYIDIYYCYVFLNVYIYDQGNPCTTRPSWDCKPWGCPNHQRRSELSTSWASACGSNVPERVGLGFQLFLLDISLTPCLKYVWCG